MLATDLLDPQETDARKCSVCDKSEDENDRNQIFQNADSLWAHIATVHSLWIPFECVLCPMMFLPTEGVLKQHYDRTHPGKVPKAIYTYAVERKAEIMRIFLESQKLTDSHRSCNNGINNVNFHSIPVTQCDKDAEVGLTKAPEKQRQQEEHCHYNSSDDEEEEEIAMEMEQEEMKLNEQINGVNRDDVNLPENDNRNAQESEEGMREKEKYDRIRVKYVTKNKKSNADVYIWCNLCEAVTNSSSKTYHIWQKHMLYGPRYSCNRCDYITSAKRRMKCHSLHKHGDQRGMTWTDHTAELRPQYLRHYQAAFGRSCNAVTYSSKNRADFKCKLCGQTLMQKSRSGHIWSRHMSENRYICRKCGHGQAELRKMKGHMLNTAHGDANDELGWIDNTHTLFDEYERVSTVVG